VADLELEGAWRVEYFDSDGAADITIFAGQSAEVRARDYYDAIERGALDTPIADAQVGTAKRVVSFPQKRRRPVRSEGIARQDRRLRWWATLIVAEDFQGLDAGVPKRAIAAQVLQSERVFPIQ
jgi:hypothetical protein